MSLAVALLSALVLQQPDPLAPAREGQLQCFQPDQAQKTCGAIGRYEFGADGAIFVNSRVAIMASPLVTFESRTAVTLRDGQECSQTDDAGADIQTIEINGAALSGPAFEQAREQIGQQLNAIIGGAELCSTYSPQTDGTIQVTTSANGVEKRELSGALIWVGADEGWTLAPAS